MNIFPPGNTTLFRNPRAGGGGGDSVRVGFTPDGSDGGPAAQAKALTAVMASGAFGGGRRRRASGMRQGGDRRRTAYTGNNVAPKAVSKAINKLSKCE